MTLIFVDTLPESVATGRKGRPEIFTEALQAEVKANPGKKAVLQTEVKGRSRLTALRTRYADAGFTFHGVVTAKQERVNAKGETVTDEILTVYVEATPVKVPATATTPKAPVKPKATTPAK